MKPELVRASFNKLEKYCVQQKFLGWDPFDGLNSQLFHKLPFSGFRLSKLAWIQLFKRSPFNFRGLSRVPKQYNSQGLGLFISGYCNLYKMEPEDTRLVSIRSLLKSLLELESPGWSGSAWGYNFEWQARAFNQPRNSPTVVASAYVANGLLDAYDLLREQRLLEKSRSICDFFLEDLNRTSGEGDDFAFSYSPLDDVVVYNASLLASRTLARVYGYTGEEKLRRAARQSVAFCCRDQSHDGSWTYGTKKYHQWIDSFHTGYNLECLSEYGRHTGDSDFNGNLELGLQYYLQNFFTADGISKYYNNKTYPVDINCPAQLTVTLFRLGRLTKEAPLMDTILEWTFKNMQDPEGYFYYQLEKRFSSKIPYMRWAQAWMFYSLSFYLLWAFESEKAN